MKQVEWGRRIASMLAALILLVGAACVTHAEDLSRIVVFRDGTSQQAQQDAVERSGSRVRNVLSLINGLAIDLPADRAAEALASLQAEPSVEGVYLDPTIAAQGEATVSAQGEGADGEGADGEGADGEGADLVIYINPVPAPPAEVYPWGLDAIGVPDTHARWPGFQGAGVTVAILDTGIDTTHPELQKNISGGVNARGDENQRDYRDLNGHGTHMAGIIAAALNRWGVVGAAPRARIYAVRVLDKNGGGKLSDLISGMGWVASRSDIRLVNMSLGFPGELVEEGSLKLLEQAVTALFKKGLIMVAAVGNRNPRVGAEGADGEGADTTCTRVALDEGAAGEGADGEGADGEGADSGAFCYRTTSVKYPAAFPQVIAVGATDIHNRVTPYTRSSDEIATHSVLAPGGDKTNGRILSTTKGGAFGEGSGTSQATAHVTGALALALQVRPDLSFQEALALLYETANTPSDLPEWWKGGGSPDAERMMKTFQTTIWKDDGGKNEKKDGKK